MAFLSKDNRENNNLDYKVRFSNISIHATRFKKYNKAFYPCVMRHVGASLTRVVAQLCSVKNAKTLSYVEVPEAVEPLGEFKVPDALPLMHTKRVRASLIGLQCCLLDLHAITKCVYCMCTLCLCIMCPKLSVKRN